MKIFDWFFGRRERTFDNVSPYAQQILVLARQEADRLFHSFVGTEHLLLALLSTSDGAVALKAVGIEPVRLKNIVEGALRPGTTVQRAATIPCTPRVMQVLKISGKEAGQLGHDFLGSEHIVLGLLRLRKGVAWQSMKTFPVTLEHARAEIRSLLSIPLQTPNQTPERTAPSGRGS
jgi:ATP-dependent Clp protease ATP-binding subunit ClpC